MFRSAGDPGSISGADLHFQKAVLHGSLRVAKFKSSAGRGRPDNTKRPGARKAGDLE
jgi:hypothetical protein